MLQKEKKGSSENITKRSQIGSNLCHLAALIPSSTTSYLIPPSQRQCVVLNEPVPTIQ